MDNVRVFFILTATLSEIFSGPTNSSILVVYISGRYLHVSDVDVIFLQYKVVCS